VVLYPAIGLGVASMRDSTIPLSIEVTQLLKAWG